MSEKAIYTEEPPVLAVEQGHGTGGKKHYTICCHGRELPDGGGWEVDMHDFWELPGNVDEAAILQDPAAWLEYIPSSERERMQAEYTAAVQAWMDAEAATRGYDNIHTASSYENSGVERFRAEGVACREWRDAVWTACYAYLDAVLAGTEAIVPVEELVERLPQMAWPSVG